MDFGELRHDVNFVTRVTDLDRCLEEIQEKIQAANEMDVTKLSKEERIKQELFLCYATNTLYYIYLKINGTNVNEVSLGESFHMMAYTTDLWLFSSTRSKTSCLGSGKQCCVKNSWRTGR